MVVFVGVVIGDGVLVGVVVWVWCKLLVFRE